MPLWNLFLPRHYYLISCLFTDLVNVLTWQCNFVDDDDMIFICFLFAQSSNIIKYFKAIHLTRDMWSCLPTTHQGVHSILSYIILFGLSPANVLINFLNFEFPFQVMISSLIASLKEVNSENAANHTTCNACAVSHHLRRSENPQIPVPKVFGHILTERRPEVVKTRFKLEIKDIGQFYMHRCPRHSRALCIVLHVEISIAW